MSFLKIQDFKTLIKENVLDDITGVDDTIVDTCSRTAQVEMESYLRQHFDVASIFDPTQDDEGRNELIVTYAIDIALYHIHARIDPKYIPDIRRERYTNAKNWLKDVSEGNITPDLPAKPLKDENGNTTSRMRYGSLPKFQSDY